MQLPTLGYEILIILASIIPILESVTCFTIYKLFVSFSFPEPQPINHCSEEPFSRSEEEYALSPEDQRSPEVTILACTPSPPPPPSPSPPLPPPPEVKEKTTTPKLFTPSKLSFTVRTKD